MINIKLIPLSLGVCLLVACGQSTPNEVNDPRFSADSEPESGEPTMMMLDDPSDGEAADPNAPPPPPGTVAAAPSEMQQSPLKGYSRDEDGKALEIVEALNLAVESYERNRPGSDIEENSVVWPELTSLDQLVKVGIIRAVPAPPEGKQWQIDPATKKVTVVDAQ